MSLRLPFLLLLASLALVGCDDADTPTDGGASDAGSDDRLHCSAAMPTGCYEFSGSCTPTTAVCIDDYWSCTTPEDFAEMGIACETM